MGHEISIDDLHGIAEIRLAERSPHGEHVKARDELLEICRARQIRKLLIDARGLRGKSPATMELFDFGASWAELAQRNRIVVAGVLPQDAAAQKWWEFGETVAVNRGFAGRIFDDLDKAREWLRDAQ